MTKTNTRKTINAKTVRILAVVLTLFTVFSCKNIEEGKGPEAGAASVKVNIKGDSFDGIDNIGTKGSPGQKVPEKVQRNTIALNKDFTLVAEMTAEEPMAANRFAGKADTGTIKENIRYKVVAYDDKGVYHSEHDYVRGQESSAPPFMLDGGSKYTFIAYSVNSVDVVPAVVFTDPGNPTLSTSTVAINGDNDFMYFSKEMTVTGSADNYLDVVLKHKLSQITTTIDASLTGQSVMDVTSELAPQSPVGTVNLSNGTVVRSGKATTAAVSFPTVNAPVVVSKPTIVNADVTGTGIYRITSMTIGDVNRFNITAFNNLTITPGVKYNLKLTVMPRPTDAYLVHAGYPAVLLNGDIWMRHNLGADTSLNPDQVPSVQGLHGNYYQWGRKEIVATASTPDDSIARWDVTIPPVNAWNSGTEADPIKTVEDPCPAGYRIPTFTEMQRLLTANMSSIGTWDGNPTNFSAARVYSSATNPDIKIVLPLAGRRSNINGEQWERAATARLWVSQSIETGVWHLWVAAKRDAIVRDVFAYGMSVRCIAE